MFRDITDHKSRIQMRLFRWSLGSVDCTSYVESFSTSKSCTGWNTEPFICGAHNMDTLLLCNALNVFRITKEFLTENDGVRPRISSMFHDFHGKPRSRACFHFGVLIQTLRIRNRYCLVLVSLTHIHCAKMC